jgi:hypothetical protein
MSYLDSEDRSHEQHISYAKSKSYATLRREDPNFVTPNFAHAISAKRVREAEESDVRAKREKVADADDEEMDIEDDDEAGPASTVANSTSCLFVLLPATMEKYLRHLVQLSV